MFAESGRFHGVELDVLCLAHMAVYSLLLYCIRAGLQREMKSSCNCLKAFIRFSQEVQSYRSIDIRQTYSICMQMFLKVM